VQRGGGERSEKKRKDLQNGKTGDTRRKKKKEKIKLPQGGKGKTIYSSYDVFREKEGPDKEGKRLS